MYCSTYYIFCPEEQFAILTVSFLLSSFVRDNIDCKESLVSSACGEETGKLAFHVLRIDTSKDMQKKMCPIKHKENGEGRSTSV